MLLLRHADRELGLLKQAAWAVNRVLVEQFIASHPEPPREIILDFDATDDRVHGEQQKRFFHGYYDDYVTVL